MSAHVTDRLSAYLDGALDVRDLERVQAHVETCANCLREYEELRALRGLLQGLRAPAPPEGFADRIHWRLTREAAHRLRPSLRDALSFRPFPLRLALALATLLLLIGLPLGWLSGRVGVREAPLDMDTYLRHYLVLSADRSLTDEVATTLVTSDVPAPEPPLR
ncbi:MAG TPA: zf-HC2 domain-containing protein [bacterium]|nr:zf-HC2 domain-containing protein [bacterium]